MSLPGSTGTESLKVTQSLSTVKEDRRKIIPLVACTVTILLDTSLIPRFVSARETIAFLKVNLCQQVGELKYIPVSRAALLVISLS